jgi:hypothetical protein
VVEADKRTVLDITVHEDEALEEIGKPNVNSEKAIIQERSTRSRRSRCRDESSLDTARTECVRRGVTA